MSLWEVEYEFGAYISSVIVQASSFEEARQRFEEGNPGVFRWAKELPKTKKKEDQ